MCWFVEYGFDEVEYCFVGEWIDCGWLLGDMVGVVLVLCDCWVMLVGYVECEVIDQCVCVGYVDMCQYVWV